MKLARTHPLDSLGLELRCGVPADPHPSSSKQSYRLTLRYDGRAYYGWQRHSGKATVQASIEAAIEESFGAKCALHGSGRTDRGVHADAQVAHFEAPFDSEADQVCTDLNALLPEDIEITRVERVSKDFHAREKATAKTYRYEIWNAVTCPPEREGRVWHIPGALDVDALEAACPVFVGEHDFASFAKKTNYTRASTVRDVSRVDLQREGDLIVLRFRANGFLYKMVRNLVRALVKVGEGRTTHAQLAEILEARDRKAAPGTAPASGLFLESVEYPAEFSREHPKETP